MRKTANISLAEALLAEDLNDNDTTSIHAVVHSTLWEHVNQKVQQTSKAESKSDSNSQLGPSKRKARKALADSDVH